MADPIRSILSYNQGKEKGYRGDIQVCVSSKSKQTIGKRNIFKSAERLSMEQMASSVFIRNQ